MKILITGGTGLIGKAFIESFDEHDFTVLTRSPAKSLASLGASIRIIDSLDRLQHLDLFDAVINLAGEPIINKRWSDKQKEVICQSRWKITQQLVDLFAESQNPPSVFLSGSATGVYGNRGKEIISEKTLVKDSDFPSKVCTNWEAIALKAAPYTRVVLLRTSVVLATHGGALARMLLPFKCCLGGRIGSGQQYMPWIHYQDMVNALDFLINQEAISGPVNLVSPEAATNQYFSKALAKSLHRPAILPMPEFILRFVLGESSCLLLDSQKVTPAKLLESGFEFQFSNLHEAFADLLN